MEPGDSSTTERLSHGGARAMSRLRAERIVAAAQRLSFTEYVRRIDSSPANIIASKVRGTPGAAARTISSLVPAADTTYLQQSGINFLLEDLVKRLQEDKPEQPALFIANYFASVLHNSHVRAREFEFINGTLQNRIAFLGQLQRSLANVDQAIEITSDDFAEIVWSHCSDFSSLPLSQACSHLDEGPEGSISSTLQGFLQAFGACFVYNEFLTKVHDVYTELISASRDAPATSPRGGTRSESIASAMAADRVVARLRLIAQQTSITIPPLGDVEAFVFKTSSFKEFCALFFTSPAIASAIRELQVAFETLSRSDVQIL